ncbi:MAG: adenylate/guanylate cyclase domain-containing protein [candidate division NC10 bacterium]|nr:adenylate/guanylate cyclase domain-containing protein [candidate division NC10 bacterium]
MRFFIKTKLILLITLLILSSMGLTSIFLFHQGKQSLSEEVEKRGAVMLHMLAQDSKGPLLSGDDLLLHKFVSEVTKSEGVVYAMVCNKEGRIQAHSRLSLVGKVFTQDPAAKVVQKSPVMVRLIKGKGPDVLDLAEPIFYGGIKIGEVRLGISTRLITDTVMIAQYRILIITLLSLLAGTAGSIVLATFLARPVRRLTEGVRAIGSGALDYRIDVTTSDELGELTQSFNVMAESLQKKKLIEEAFGRYVTKQVASEILKHPEAIQLGGRRQVVSVLFADIRGFTSLAERIEPEEVVRTLNEYLTLMTKVVFKHDGTLDKFLGDAIMAVFGAPIFYADHALRAILAALDIRREIGLLNEKRAAAGMQRVEIGIGINAGEVVTGTIGSEERMEYTVIGDNVNIAARLEDLAGEGQILISPSIYEAVSHKVSVRILNPIRLKGREKLLQVYEVIGLLG